MKRVLLKQMSKEISDKFKLNYEVCDKVLKYYIFYGRESLLEGNTWGIPGVVRFSIRNLNYDNSIQSYDFILKLVSEKLGHSKEFVERIVSEYNRLGVIYIQKGYRWVIPTFAVLGVDIKNDTVKLFCCWSKPFKDYIYETMLNLYKEGAIEWLYVKNCRTYWDNSFVKALKNDYGRAFLCV